METVGVAGKRDGARDKQGLKTQLAPGASMFFC